MIATYGTYLAVIIVVCSPPSYIVISWAARPGPLTVILTFSANALKFSAYHKKYPDKHLIQCLSVVAVEKVYQTTGTLCNHPSNAYASIYELSDFSGCRTVFSKNINCPLDLIKMPVFPKPPFFEDICKFLTIVYGIATAEVRFVIPTYVRAQWSGLYL
jgi:hypothetical protein